MGSFVALRADARSVSVVFHVLRDALRVSIDVQLATKDENLMIHTAFSASAVAKTDSSVDSVKLVIYRAYFNL